MTDIKPSPSGSGRDSPTPPRVSLSPTPPPTSLMATGDSSSDHSMSNNISSLRITGSPPPGQETEAVPSILSSSTAHQQNKLKSILPPVAQCTYTPCYCEENIWKLCDKIRVEYSTELDYCHVAFISNPKRMVPLWRQKSGKNEDRLAIWDYHVVLLYNPDDRCVVYDMDSDLPFPTFFHKYVTETFRTENILQPEYHRFFRIFPASKFLNVFSSDRSHMLKPDGSGEYLHPPPPFPPICKNGVNNLEHFLDMTIQSNTDYGEFFNLMELVRRYHKPKPVLVD